jgi:hypothetical protein
MAVYVLHTTTLTHTHEEEKVHDILLYIIIHETHFTIFSKVILL